MKDSSTSRKDRLSCSKTVPFLFEHSAAKGVVLPSSLPSSPFNVQIESARVAVT